MSDGKAFFDTNVLLYMFSGVDLVKRRRAESLFAEYSDSNRIVLSTHVVQEFYVVGLRKLGVPRTELRETVGDLLDLAMVTVGPQHIVAAFQIEERYQISFWDALILAAAEAGGADVLFSEDLNHGQSYGSVTVQNPFLI